MGLNKHLTLEIDELYYELDDGDQPLSEARRREILARIDELEEIQKKYSAGLRSRWGE
jgi:hypothetical protein